MIKWADLSESDKNNLIQIFTHPAAKVRIAGAAAESYSPLATSNPIPHPSHVLSPLQSQASVLASTDGQSPDQGVIQSQPMPGTE